VWGLFFGLIYFNSKGRSDFLFQSSLATLAENRTRTIFFFKTVKMLKADYQIEKATNSVGLSGGIIGAREQKKCFQKFYLPQSSSGFYFAIIIEGMCLVGGLLLVFFTFFTL